MNGTLLLLLFCFLVFCAALLGTVQNEERETSAPVTVSQQESFFSGIIDKITGIFSSDRPLIMLEEEVEITVDIPRGVDFDNMASKSNRTLAAPVRAQVPARIERPTIVIEEEDGTTREIPQETTFDSLSQKNFDTTSIVDVYGLGLPAVEP